MSLDGRSCGWLGWTADAGGTLSAPLGRGQIRSRSVRRPSRAIEDQFTPGRKWDEPA